MNSWQQTRPVEKIKGYPPRRITLLTIMVPKGGFEPPLPCGNCALNAARLPVPPLWLTRYILGDRPMPVKAGRHIYPADS